LLRYISSPFFSNETKAILSQLNDEIIRTNFEKVDEHLYITIDIVKELAIASDGLFQFVILKPFVGGWELLDMALGPSHTGEYITSFNSSSQVR
jgi:hypothetical protein